MTHPTHPISSEGPRGIVYLVGAGPGDADLITLRGLRILRDADVIVHDALIDRRLLRLNRRGRRIDVGKRAGRTSPAQASIHAILLREAALGRRVVRLKGGDPLVFGRGGEEIDALSAAGVPFAIVPGVTSALAAAADAGIALTHRDRNSRLVFATSRRGDAGAGDAPAMAAWYMGVAALERLIAELIAGGADPGTPAAAVESAGTTRARVVRAALRDLPAEARRIGLAAPAMFLVGAGAAPLARDQRPLRGATIAVTRPPGRGETLRQRLAAAGAEVLLAPLVRWGKAPDRARLDAALRDLHRCAWVCFTSETGVRRVAARLRALRLDARAFGAARLAAVGPSTARALLDALRLRADLLPARADAASLARALVAAGGLRARRVALLRALEATGDLPDLLAQAGAVVDDIAVYATRQADALPANLSDAIRRGALDWIVLASGSAARALAALAPKPLPARVRLAAMGPRAAEAARAVGLQVHAVAEEPDAGSLVAAITRAGARAGA